MEWILYWCRRNDSKLFPVCYASKKLSDAERNYFTIEKECLAIVWALQSYNIRVEAIKGFDNVGADYMSRVIKWRLPWTAPQNVFVGTDIFQNFFFVKGLCYKKIALLLIMLLFIIKLAETTVRTAKNSLELFRTFRNFPYNILEAIELLTHGVIFWNILEHLVVYN